MIKDMTRSAIEISNIDNKSILTGSKIFRPLKIFSLQKGRSCQIVFSNYGGGFVEGDQIYLDILCKAGTTTAFSTQANTRIYRSEHDKSSLQETIGKVDKDGLAVFMGDPIVPHQNSIFEQKIRWDLAEGSTLLFLDWFEAGRILNGERFAFKSFFTDLKINIADTIVIWDRFKMDPEQNNMNSPGAFLNHSSYLNIFLAGNENLEKVKLIENHLHFISRKYFFDDKGQEVSKCEILGSACKVNENVFMIRCSAKNNHALQPIVKELAQLLSDKELLGFNPMEGRV
ncbi:MAG: urease accessory protein UreD [Sporocytophaga sp.]|uniref:urease accessory protein UreD n=1 Tax=Sporocytophaga sp. TaxID=2231183 RepID=UPI001B007FEB|nr:urease accessory protein UreD [Sporocytophaga sp.]MBO9698884.1 urease accessory protein UreD [Sporocytophaga sp.]